MNAFKNHFVHMCIFTGLAFDEWDIDFYTDMFLQKLKRNPTSVECFDLAQSNSEHSRHWFFKVLLQICIIYTQTLKMKKNLISYF